MTTAMVFEKQSRASLTLYGYKKHFQRLTDWLELLLPRSVATLVRARARFIDEVLQQLWRHYQLHQHRRQARLQADQRGELHPYSDIDLTILTESRLSPEQQEQISQFVTILWDLRLESATVCALLKKL